MRSEECPLPLDPCPDPLIPTSHILHPDIRSLPLSPGDRSVSRQCVTQTSPLNNCPGSGTQRRRIGDPRRILRIIISLLKPPATSDQPPTTISDFLFLISDFPLRSSDHLAVEHLIIVPVPGSALGCLPDVLRFPERPCDRFSVNELHGDGAVLPVEDHGLVVDGPVL